MDIENKAQNDLPFLLNKCNELSALSQKILTTVSKGSNEYFDLMVFWFCNRQYEHFKSVIYLCEKGMGRDAGLIMRSMIEGLAQLFYALKDKEKYARQWYEFSYVEVWKKMVDSEEIGDHVDESMKKIIQKNVDKYGHQFLHKKSKDKKEKGLPLTKKSYVTNWFNWHYSNLIKEIIGDTFLKKIYQPVSAWHHWSPESEEIVSFNNNEYNYIEARYSNSATALATGFQCLIQTLEVHIDHFKLDFIDDIKLIKDKFLDYHNQQE